METTRLSSKGQVILPKAVRDARRWQPGTELIVENTADGVLLRPAKAMAPTGIDEVAGFLKVSGPPRTLKDMDDAIAAEVGKRRGRGRY